MSSGLLWIKKVKTSNILIHYMNKPAHKNQKEQPKKLLRAIIASRKEIKDGKGKILKSLKDLR